MSTEDTPDVDSDEATDPEPDEDDADEVRQRLEREADRAVEQFDQGIVDLLSWVLDTETRARIYVHLRQNPADTSDEVAAGTGLYPSTVREALAELHDEGRVTRVKRESSGAGNNPYEYSAMPPSDLVQDIVEDLQSELNTVFNLDNYLGGDDEPEAEPVTVTVTEEGAVDDAGEPEDLASTEDDARTSEDDDGTSEEDAGTSEDDDGGTTGDAGTDVPVRGESEDGDSEDETGSDSGDE